MSRRVIDLLVNRSSAAKNFVWEGPVNDVVSHWRLSNSW